jgi:excisionase family DNA binding protein
MGCTEPRRLHRMDEMLTPKEVAKMLKVSDFAIRKWLKEKKLRGVKLGDLWRIRKQDLDEFINNNLTEKPKNI